MSFFFYFFIFFLNFFLFFLILFPIPTLFGLFGRPYFRRLSKLLNYLLGCTTSVDSGNMLSSLLMPILFFFCFLYLYRLRSDLILVHGNLALSVGLAESAFLCLSAVPYPAEQPVRRKWDVCSFFFLCFDPPFFLPFFFPPIFQEGDNHVAECSYRHRYEILKGEHLNLILNFSFSIQSLEN